MCWPLGRHATLCAHLSGATLPVCVCARASSQLVGAFARNRASTHEASSLPLLPYHRCRHRAAAVASLVCGFCGCSFARPQQHRVCKESITCANFARLVRCWQAKANTTTTTTRAKARARARTRERKSLLRVRRFAKTSSQTSKRASERCAYKSVTWSVARAAPSDAHTREANLHFASEFCATSK